MYFDACAVEAQTIDGHADHVMLLKRIKQPIQSTRVGPPAHPGVNRVPLAETRRQRSPFAAILNDKEDGVDHGQVRNPHITALNWQVGADEYVLLTCYLIYNKNLTGICIM